jgi:hypothetical protein
MRPWLVTVVLVLVALCALVWLWQNVVVSPR